MRDVVATAAQGLAVGGPAEVGYDKATLPYVPGSTVRGALASAWIREHGLPSRDSPRREEFIGLFERDVRYGPLFQEGTALRPLTAVFCKYPRGADCVSWGVDAAVDGPAASCPHCGGAVDHGKGDIDGVRVRRVMRTELDASGRAREGSLFTRHELARGLTYRGRLIGHHAWLDDEHEVWIGGRTSTAGMATIRTAPTSEAPPAVSPRSDGALVLRFTSPALIVDPAGRPCLDPVPDILAALGVPGTGVRRWIRAAQVGGWHAASGLPKPMEIAIAMGSAVVFDLAEPAPEERLRTLAREGIGLRRVEGFGTVEVNPPAWRPTPPPAAPTADTTESPLTQLRELGLLDDITVLRWVIDRSRQVLIDRERGRQPDLRAISAERVAVYLDDDEYDAVRDLFGASNLAAAIPVLELTLERLEGAQ